MEHSRLLHSPIVEAVCEFRFAPEATWDWAVPGLLAPALEADFPTRKQLYPAVVEFGSPPEHAPQLAPERVQFLSRDELSMVQSGPRMLAVNQLSPYPGWSTFSSRVLHALDVHTEKCGWQPLQRLGLLYINRLLSEEPVDRVLTIAPRTEAMPTSVRLSKFVQQWEMDFDHSSIALTATRVADPASFVLQLDAFTYAHERLQTRASVLAWLEQAHDTVYEVFESSLSLATLGRLRGES